MYACTNQQYQGCGTTGWLVTLSIMLHEIPAEIGDFFVLLHGTININSIIYIKLFTT